MTIEAVQATEKGEVGMELRDPAGETARLLAALRERLQEAQDAGQPLLKLEPEDVARLCSGAGVADDAAGSFRTLVRQDLTRLRGRWRENHSAVRVPVYVERITERGLRLLAGTWRPAVSGPPPGGKRGRTRRLRTEAHKGGTA